VALGIAFVACTHAANYPVRISTGYLDYPPYNSTGLLFSEIGLSAFRGSAVVARDPRLLYTCAHIFYDRGRWSTDNTFALGWHASGAPAPSQMVSLRGYRYYSSYAGSSRSADYDLDFAIGYRTLTTSFGPALGWYEEGGPSLRSSSTSKLILGYPARRDYDGSPGYYYQHYTGTFRSSMRQTYGSYHTLTGLSTGGGNSGGPVLVNYNGDYYLAGILVSGSSSSIGVHALDVAASTMAKNALASIGVSVPKVTKTIKNTSRLTLPDAARTYSYRIITVSGMPSSTTDTRFSLQIATPRRGDLDVYLRSPSGRVRWIKTHKSGENTDHLIVSKANYTSSFSGYNPNGFWRIYMRDYYSKQRAVFRNAALTVTSR
jgi:hypothetical protein